MSVARVCARAHMVDVKGLNANIRVDNRLVSPRVHALTPAPYWAAGYGPACANGELYGFSRPLLQLIRPLAETPVRSRCMLKGGSDRDEE